MSKEIYIVIGLCVFAFLIGLRIKKAFKSQSKKKSKNKAEPKKKELSPTQIKLRRIFTIAMLVFVFSLLIFMIPALSRDILTANGVIDDNLILRIIIVGFAIYILFMGYVKIRKSK
jgi:p-aminobenzoyl-glutamate transporter AbgT